MHWAGALGRLRVREPMQIHTSRPAALCWQGFTSADFFPGLVTRRGVTMSGDPLTRQ